MVDLVKIRKKAREQKEERAASSHTPESSVPVPEPAPMPEPAPGFPLPVSSRLARYLETAGERRDVVKKQDAAAAPAEQRELLTFTMAGEHYAVDIERVLEIITPRPVTRVPNADPSVVGILSLRGTIVVVVDVRELLGHAPAGAPDADTRIIIMQRDGENAGFFVDSVRRVVKMDKAALQPHPVAHTSEQDASIRGVFRIGHALTILLDLDKLLERAVSTDGTHL